MSAAYYLVSPETRQAIRIGQGTGHLESLYHGEKETMKCLKKFLDDTQGFPLFLRSDSTWDQTELDYEIIDPIIHGRKDLTTSFSISPEM